MESKMKIRDDEHRWIESGDDDKDPHVEAGECDTHVVREKLYVFLNDIPLNRRLLCQSDTCNYLFGSFLTIFLTNKKNDSGQIFIFKLKKNPLKADLFINLG